MLKSLSETVFPAQLLFNNVRQLNESFFHARSHVLGHIEKYDMSLLSAQSAINAAGADEATRRNWGKVALLLLCHILERVSQQVTRTCVFFFGVKS